MSTQPFNMSTLASLPERYLQSNFPKWMFWSRVAQVILTVTVLGLDAFAIDRLNGYLRALPSSAGLVMFTVILTLIVLPYTFIAPRLARNFYHVHVEVILEFFLAFFWLISWAYMADYVATIAWADNYTNSITGTTIPSANIDAWLGGKNAINASKAVAGLGALLFLLSGANFIFLVAYVLRLRRNRKASEAAAASGGATMTNDPEMGMEENKNAAAMPPGFAGANGEH